MDLYEFHLGTVSLASLIYTIMFIPMEFLNLCRKLKGQKWIMKCCALFPEALTLWFASLTEMLSGSPIYTCAMYSVPFCMATNRSMVLTNFAMRLRIIMLGNVLCTMCIILVSLASTVLTLAMANPEYRDHAVYFGLFLFLFSTLISSMLLVVFLVSRMGRVVSGWILIVFLCHSLTERYQESLRLYLPRHDGERN